MFKSKSTLKRERRQGEADARDEERDRVEAEKAEKYRYLPASYRALDELAEEVGQPAADKIKALVDALIEEANRPSEAS